MINYWECALFITIDICMVIWGYLLAYFTFRKKFRYLQSSFLMLLFKSSSVKEFPEKVCFHEFCPPRVFSWLIMGRCKKCGLEL